jgi:hypothetical protein
MTVIISEKSWLLIRVEDSKVATWRWQKIVCLPGRREKNSLVYLQQQGLTSKKARQRRAFLLLEVS